MPGKYDDFAHTFASAIFKLLLLAVTVMAGNRDEWMRSCMGLKLDGCVNAIMDLSVWSNVLTPNRIDPRPRI